MTDDERFRELMQCAHQGDTEAVYLLVHIQRPHLERAIRLQMARTPKIRPAVGASDIFQTVFRRFFVEFLAGTYDAKLATPQELLKLLRTIARNRISTLAKTQNVIAHDNDLSLLAQQMTDGDAPSGVAAGRELWRTVKERLSPVDFRIVEMRTEKHTWDEIGSELNITAEAARARLAHRIRRILEDLDPAPSTHA